MIEAIGRIDAAALASQVPTAPSLDAASDTGNTDFASMLASQMAQANGDIGRAESAIQQLASGQPIELHDVMISLEKARISVQTIIQVRNRVLDVYQDLMRMQL